MSLFDDIAKTVSDATSATAKKAGQVTDTAKLRLSLHNEREKLDRCFLEIGRLYYEYRRTGADTAPRIAELTLAADTHRGRIEKLEGLLRQGGSYKLCPLCKARLKKNMAYCHSCGARQDA